MSAKFYTAQAQKQMTTAQQKSFERSYQSYVKQYNKLVEPAEKMFNRSEYFEEYKTFRKMKVSQGKTTAALPRQIAAAQKYERSYTQDLAQWKALQKTENFKKMHGTKTFADFRRLEKDDLKEFLWSEIYQARADKAAAGATAEEINTFISSYYFGSD